VHALAASITLFLTILVSFVLGITAGYAVIRGILQTFGGHSRRAPKPARAAEQTGD
jgi:hypothetical protein